MKSSKRTNQSPFDNVHSSFCCYELFKVLPLTEANQEWRKCRQVMAFYTQMGKVELGIKCVCVHLYGRVMFPPHQVEIVSRNRLREHPWKGETKAWNLFWAKHIHLFSKARQQVQRTLLLRENLCLWAVATK